MEDVAHAEEINWVYHLTLFKYMKSVVFHFTDFCGYFLKSQRKSHKLSWIFGMYIFYLRFRWWSLFFSCSRRSSVLHFTVGRACRFNPELFERTPASDTRCSLRQNSSICFWPFRMSHSKQKKAIDNVFAKINEMRAKTAFALTRNQNFLIWACCPNMIIYCDTVS